MKVLLMILISTFMVSFCWAQKENNVWNFGYGVQANFNSGNPVFEPGSQLNSWEGCSSISDRNGNLLFYSDGMNVWDRSNAIMQNGNLLQGDTISTISSLIVPFPGSNTLYYLFTINSLESKPGDLKYNIIDITLNGGLGGVVVGSKNIPLETGLLEKVAAVRHANTKDVWLVCHSANNSNFIVYNINCNGIDIASRSVQSIGLPVIVAPVGNAIGYMRFSPNCRRLAIANFWTNIQVFDFDNETGILSNYQLVDEKPAPISAFYGIQFSPNSQVLYATELTNKGDPGNYYLWQYDLNAPNIPLSRYEVYSEKNGNPVPPAAAMQLANNRQVYVAHSYAGFLSTIANPNVIGIGCNFSYSSVAIPNGNLSGLGLPAFVEGIDITLLGNDISVCEDSVVTLRTPILQNTTKQWSNSSTADTLNVTQTGYYWVDIFHNGCTYRDSIYVEFRPKPIINFPNDTTVCANLIPVNLTRTIPGATYVWNDGSIGNSILVDTTGLYWLEATLNGCSRRDSIQVNIAALPTYSFGADTSVCEETIVTLNPGVVGTSYLWSTGATSTFITTDTSGTFWCKVTNAFGCTYTDTINVQVRPKPVVNLGADVIICNDAAPLRIGQTIAGATYNWSTMETSDSISITNTGLYWLEATINGCSRRDSINVTINPVTTYSFGADTSVCEETIVTLNPGVVGTSYLWSTGATSTFITTDTSGTFWCKVTNAFGCTYTDTINVQVRPKPVVNLGADVIICNDAAPLRIGQTIAGATYNWSTSENTDSIQVNTSNVYWLEATINGCSRRDSINVTINPVPTYSFGADTSVCEETIVTLNPGVVGTSYLWSTGATAAFITTDTTGTFWCKVTNAFGCTYTDTINVQVRPKPVVNLGADVIICNDAAPLRIGQTIAGATYNWSTSENTDSIQVNTSNVYWLEATINGCSRRDSINVTINPVPTYSFGADTSVCEETIVTLNPGVVGTSYLWSTGATAAFITTDTTGTFWCKVTNAFGCTYTDTINVQVRPKPVVNLGADVIICNDAAPLMIGQTIAGATYNWSTSASTDSILVSTSDVYWMEATINGCSRRDSINVTINPVPTYSFGADTSVCEETIVTLNPGVVGTSYLWSTGATSTFITTDTTGTFWCKVTNAFGCTYTDTINVQVRPKPVVNLGADVIICNDAAPLRIGQTIAGASYIWSTMETSDSISITNTGLYWLEATINGCSRRDSINVTINPVPTYSFGADTSVCEETIVTLNPGVVGTSYLWSTGETAAFITTDTTGTFWCKVTNAFGCTYTDTINVQVRPKPVVNLGADVIICNDAAPLRIGQTIAGATYNWSTSATTDSIQVNTSDVYWMEATINGCSRRDSINVTINPVPTYSFGADTSVCEESIVTLNPGVVGTSYLWSTGATSAFITTDTTGTFWCKVTNAFGCTYTDTINVQVRPKPVVNLGADVIICNDAAPLRIGQTIVGATYNWSTMETSDSISITNTGLYWLEASINGCSRRDSINVTINPVPTYSFGADTSVCEETIVTLNPGVVGTSYLWSTGATSAFITTDTTGTFWCKVTNAFGCTYTDTINVQVRPKPVVNLGADVIICNDAAPLRIGQTIVGATYNWSTMETSDSISITNTGLYWLEATINGCSRRDSINVTINPVPTYSFGADTSVCEETIVTLNPSVVGTSYLWSTGASAAFITTDTTGTFWCKVTNAFGCNYTDTINVQVRPKPVVNLGADVIICNDAAPLRIGQTIAGATYNWSTMETSDSISITNTGLYWLEATINGCSRRDSINVTINPVPTYSFGADTSVCEETIVTLNPGVVGTSYLWSTGATSTFITTDTTGTFWCKVTNAFGCTYTDTINVQVRPKPVVNLGADVIICNDAAPLRIGQTIAGATYNWSTMETSDSISITNTGLYWLEATINGCSRRDSINVTINPVPTYSFGADTSICEGQLVSLNVPISANSYLWNTGSTQSFINVSAAGLYWCKVSNQFGCTYTDSIQVFVKPKPIVNLGADIFRCENLIPFQIGQTINGASYLWSNGATSDSISITSTGLYWMQATLNGCSNRDSINVTINPVPTFSLGNDTSICEGSSVQLNSSINAFGYLWNTGENTPTIVVQSTGWYWCEVLNTAGCSYRDSIFITVKPKPLLNLGADKTICSSEAPIPIYSNIPADQFLWSSGETTPFLSVGNSGSYWLKATVNGCSSVDTINITINPTPIFNLGVDKTICEGESVNISSGVTGSYLWNTGSTLQQITVNTSGIYWLDVSSSFGCTYRDSIQVTVKPKPHFSLGNDTILCDNASYTIDLSGIGDLYLWQDGNTSPRYTFNKSGRFHVKISKEGCEAADTLVVVAKKTPTPNLGPDLEICPGELIVLNPKFTDGTYLWQDGASTPTYQVSQIGLYKVTITNECGVGEDSIVIGKGACILRIPNAFTPGKSTNSVFKVLNRQLISDFKMSLYNRWGQKVFETTDPARGWDGRINGILQPTGAYVYIVVYKDVASGKAYSHQGGFVLIR